MPSLEQLLESLPAYANDLKLNLAMALRQPELTPLQIWGTAVASAAAARNPVLLETITAEAGKILERPHIDAALAANAIMSMNNIYFRFLHAVGHDKYSTIPSHLRMNVMRTHAAAPVDFELWCVAVSAINGCGECMEAHDRVVRELGLTEESVLAAIRIASVLYAIAAVLG
jgi:alkyl hydroperoxide reductase subunit D